MTDKRFEAAIAGLLHDVGKITQRASDTPQFAPGDTQEEGQPVHAAYSIRFIEELLAHDERLRRIALHGAYHHRPQNNPAADPKLSWLVALADKLSAGERSDPNQDEKKGQFPQQMLTIFDSISLTGAKKAGSQPAQYLPLTPLALKEDSIFPSDAAGERQQARSAYERLREEMRTGFKRIQGESLAAALEQMVNTLQRSAWSVPSAYYYSRPDVSLYDHSRMTAALAVCLSDLELEQIRANHDAVVRQFTEKPVEGDDALLGETAAILLGGDISGIQDFIYTITARQAAKTLRGRSFYLQLLTEAVLRFTLRELDLPYTNVIYSGGGHFYLLAPVSAVEQFPALRRAVSERLLDAHGIGLYLSLGYAEVPFSGFQRGQFPEYWGKMHQQLALKKNSRYTEFGSELYARVFEPKEHGGNKDDVCSVCGMEQGHATPTEDDGEKIKVCPLCESFSTEIGKLLPNARFLTLGFGNPQQDDEKPSAEKFLRSFGMHMEFVSARNKKVQVPGWVEQIVVWALDDEPADAYPQVERHSAVHAVRYIVNQVPEMDFNDLQEIQKVKGEGIHRLGVLRMDVDNLGTIFQKGFGAEVKTSSATLSRLSTLSFQMSLFFEGWVKRIIEEDTFKQDGKPLIYAVYTGGDDLFLIGPWQWMPKLALKIVDSFADYTGGHPDLHLSGGMSFIHGKYPVHEAAEDAGALEAQAKSLEGKNAFAFLGGVWHWADFKRVADKKALLKEIQLAGGSRSILQLLQELARQQAEREEKGHQKPLWGPWMWRGDYQLFRMNERARNVELKQLYESLREQLHATDPAYAEIADWGKAARWTQLDIRKSKES